jgi:membrane-associated phospholipid phosphatase
MFILSYVVLAAAFTAVGLLLVHVLFVHGRGSWDVIGVNRWYSARFTPGVERWSGDGSHIGETLSVVAVAAVIVIVLLLLRHWRSALFIATALVLEVTVFLTLTAVVHRARPDVPKPEQVPPTSSFPSGHTAASVTLYLSVAVLIARHVRNRVVRVLVILAGLLPGAFVAVSRVARGMHHPTDVIAGFLLGILCVLAAGLLVRVVDDVAADRKQHRPEDLEVTA